MAYASKSDFILFKSFLSSIGPTRAISSFRGAINTGILVILPDQVTRVPSPWGEAVISC